MITAQIMSLQCKINLQYEAYLMSKYTRRISNLAQIETIVKILISQHASTRRFNAWE